MQLQVTIEALKAERDRMMATYDGAITTLEGLNNEGAPVKAKRSGAGKATRGWSQASRDAAAKRMKRFWAQKRKGK